MLRLTSIIIIDFYSAYLKKNIGAKKNKIITINLITGRKHSPPIRKCIKSLQTCKTEKCVTTVDEAPVCTVAK